MTTSKALIPLLLSSTLLASGCQTTQTAFDNDCKVAGTAIGAVAGGLAGALLFGKGNGKAGTALIGAAAGAFVGNQLGSLLDCHDQKAVNQAGQRAAEAPMGERVLWASTTADVPEDVPAPRNAEPTASPTMTSPGNTTTAPARTSAVVTPAKPKLKAANDTKATTSASNKASGQWSVVEPVRSTGSSGMWGWVEPVSPPTTTADGRTCRQLKQVAVDKAGSQHEEAVTSCLNDQRQWVIASR